MIVFTEGEDAPTTSIKVFAILAISVATLPACSPGGNDAETAPSPPSISGPATSAAEPEDGRVVVTHELTPATASYEEGSVSFAVVTDEQDREVATAREEAPGTSQIQTLMDVVLPQGTYKISIHQQGCAGDCEFLDAEIRERCEYTFRVVSSRTTELSYVFTPLGNPDCAISENN
jgi:hypothetical protein